MCVCVCQYITAVWGASWRISRVIVFARGLRSPVSSPRSPPPPCSGDTLTFMNEQQQREQAVKWQQNRCGSLLPTIPNWLLVLILRKVPPTHMAPSLELMKRLKKEPLVLSKSNI